MIGIILPKTTFVTVLVKGVSRIFVHGVGLQKKLKNASDICLYVFFLRFYSLDNFSFFGGGGNSSPATSLDTALAFGENYGIISYR